MDFTGSPQQWSWGRILRVMAREGGKGGRLKPHTSVSSESKSRAQNYFTSSLWAQDNSSSAKILLRTYMNNFGVLYPPLLIEKS